jgi:hypothetical protein
VWLGSLVKPKLVEIECTSRHGFQHPLTLFISIGSFVFRGMVCASKLGRMALYRGNVVPAPPTTLHCKIELGNAAKAGSSVTCKPRPNSINIVYLSEKNQQNVASRLLLPYA